MLNLDTVREILSHIRCYNNGLFREITMKADRESDGDVKKWLESVATELEKCGWHEDIEAER